MPYVLKHKETGEIYSCMMRNVYDFTYHGVRAWADDAQAAAELGSVLAEAGVDEPWQWEVAAMEDDKLKLGNVKLNNNPSRRVYWLPDGRLEARSAT